MKARPKLQVPYTHDYRIPIAVDIIIENARSADEAMAAAVEAVRVRMQGIAAHVYDKPIHGQPLKLNPRRFPE